MNRAAETPGENEIRSSSVVGKIDILKPTEANGWRTEHSLSLNSRTLEERSVSIYLPEALVSNLLRLLYFQVPV